MSRDPGLQPERTILAWQRTALSATVLAACLLQMTVDTGPRPMAVATVALCGVVLVLMVAMMLRHNRYRRVISPSTTMSKASACLITGSIVLIASARGIDILTR
ncbi:DUF202 domain-containing protein [Nocardia sp. FBN12]|uniref:DUF202 domain-containing protein n=1 Tax=Nocardia sp. FBN12 TaxID=3419766 RepID=UPI003D08897C